MRAIPREVGLNSNQIEVLVGTLLGDGNLSLHGKNARLHIKHSSKQCSLVNYKRQVFDSITSMKVRFFSQNVKEKSYSFCEFVTKTSSDLTYFYNLFYPNFKKVVPSNLGLFLTPISLSVWIMDDGAAEYSGLSLQTHSFEKSEVDYLRDLLFSTFGLKTSSRKNKNKWIIYFPKSSMLSLISIVDKHILNDFKYKLIPYSLRINPVETIRRTPV